MRKADDCAVREEACVDLRVRGREDVGRRASHWGCGGGEEVGEEDECWEHGEMGGCEIAGRKVTLINENGTVRPHPLYPC